jgi:hypothetical protein
MSTKKSKYKNKIGGNTEMKYIENELDSIYHIVA